jgi:hypothetical protein
MFYVLVTSINNVRFEVSTAVTMMIIIFWEMTPCGSYKNRRFGGSYYDDNHHSINKLIND